MRPLIRRAMVLIVLVVGALTPSAALAITVDQIVALKKSGVTDTVILALIDRDRTVFAIEPEQIVSLQREGLSEKVILAMLSSGRDEGEQAARADAAYNAAWIAAALPTEPISVTVGHGPDRPNTTHVDGFYSGPPATAPSFVASPYYGPSFRYRKPPFGSAASRRSSEPRALCYAQVSTARTSNQAPFVTECPAIMQPRRR
jgi:hypothetical protein